MVQNYRLIASGFLALLVALASCTRSPPTPPTSTETPQSSAEALTPQPGGEATVLLGSDFAGSWPAGLDPATNVNGGANLSLMNAVFGSLFQLRADDDGGNPRVVGDLAESHEFVDGGRTLLIHLRPDVKFSDGTPFDAEAVKFSIHRSLKSSCSCSPVRWPWDPDNPVSVVDERTVALRFTEPRGAFMNAFPATNLNWVVSPTGLRKLGEDQFKITPVGAGPFRVVTNQLSSRLVLERNPLYWQKGRPYLDRLVFQSIGGEQAAYQALVAGNAHAFEGMSSPLLIEQTEANKQLTVTRQPATSPLVIQLNTAVPPFNEQRAREAIYYATHTEAIRTGLFKNWYPVSQSFTAPGGLFHHAEVPGYRAYDPEKARSIVKELGGLEVVLGTLRSPVAEQVVTALQSQWAASGIKVKIETYDLGTLIRSFESRKWQAMLQTAGSYDPEAGSGLGFRFRSGATFSGVHDPQLDKLMDSGSKTTDAAERDAVYMSVAKYISDRAYAPFLVAQSSAQVTRGIYGPGLTTKIPPVLVGSAVLWQDVWLKRK